MTARQTATRQTKSASYDVGYGKPPRHTQFRKGQSDNPGGRPRRTATESANVLLLREAYRPITVKMAGRTVTLPAIQAVVRSQILLAAEGNVQAQRAVLAAVQTIERENMEEAAREARREAAREAAAQAVRQAEAVLQAAERAAPPAPEKMSYTEAAQRIRLLLGLDKSADKGAAGAQGKETVKEERESAQQRDAAPAPLANSAPQPDDATAAAAPPVVPPPPLADPPAAPPAASQPWRSPPPRPDRYARHAARESTPSTGPDLRARFRVLRDKFHVRYRTGNSAQPFDTIWQKESIPAQRAAKIRKFPVRFAVLRESRRPSRGGSPATPEAWRMGDPRPQHMRKRA
jgi:hypothetical protein